MSPPTAAARPRSNPVLRLGARVVNPLVLRLAGTRCLPSYGVITHYGRRSGTRFHTPVVVRLAGQDCIVPLPWGENTDWCRNVRLAGRCALRLNGVSYQLEQPEVVETRAVEGSFGAAQRLVLRVFGVTRCLRLRIRG